MTEPTLEAKAYPRLESVITTALGQIEIICDDSIEPGTAEFRQGSRVVKMTTKDFARLAAELAQKGPL